jgi:uncharacterized protein YndB with AHSA1/START domain
MSQKTPSTLVLERVLNHPPEKVWRALTQQHLVREWLLEGDIHAEEGHSFAFATGFGQIDCKVVAVEPGVRIAYTWEALGLRSVVTWTLTDQGGATLLRMEQTGFRPDQAQAYGGAHGGWKRFISNLDILLETMD